MIARCVGFIPGGAVANELQQLGAKQPHSAGRQAVGSIIIFRVLSNRLKISAKDEGRAVDEKDVASGPNRLVRQSHSDHGALFMPPPCPSPASGRGNANG